LKGTYPVLEIVRAGGLTMIPIVLCSILVLGITFERLWTLRRSRVAPPDLGAQVMGWARGRKVEVEHLSALKDNSPLGEVLAAAVANRHRSRDVIKEAVEDAGRHVAARLNRFVDTLAMISNVAPFLGLLGTVFGMINTFTVIGTQGVGDANAMASGIAQALITTAAGLIVAIPAAVAYHGLRGHTDRLVTIIEKEAIALVNALDQPAPDLAPAVSARVR
jgi:biopolymer transport protein ExbB